MVDPKGIDASFEEKIPAQEKGAGDVSEKTGELSDLEKISPQEKEKAREVSAAEGDGAYNKILSKVKKNKSVVSDDDVNIDADIVSRKKSADKQVSHLVDLSMEKGVLHAVKVARHMNDDYILDMFHDRLLAEDLHIALVERGLIDES